MLNKFISRRVVNLFGRLHIFSPLGDIIMDFQLVHKNWNSDLCESRNKYARCNWNGLKCMLIKNGISRRAITWQKRKWAKDPSGVSSAYYTVSHLAHIIQRMGSQIIFLAAGAHISDVTNRWLSESEDWISPSRGVIWRVMRIITISQWSDFPRDSVAAGFAYLTTLYAFILCYWTS